MTVKVKLELKVFKALTKLEKFIPNPGAKVLDVGTAGIF